MSIDIIHPIPQEMVEQWAEHAKAHATVETDTQALIRDLQARVYHLENEVKLIKAKGMEGVFKFEAGKPIRAMQIINAVSDWEGIPVKHMQSPSRLRHIVRARQIAVYLIRELVGLSLCEIARLFGCKDHGTVLHSLKRVAEEMEVDCRYRESIKSYMRQLKAPPQPQP